MSRSVALGLLLVLALVLEACGDGASSAPTPTTGDTRALGLTPAPPTTPGSRDPSHITAPDGAVQFVRGTLIEQDPAFEDPTTLSFGPDGRLYVGQLNGRIVALTLAGQSVTDMEEIASPEVFDAVLGLAFDPTDSPEPVTLYVSHTSLFAGESGSPFAGTISRLAAPAFERSDLISGLPVSTVEHGTNGIAFDSEGILYIAQGGTTNAGVPSERHPRPATPLSGAILVADLSDPAFDGMVLYEPPDVAGETVDQVAGDVRVYASGFRNPYDLVIHSNGRLYATDNGPNAPDGAESLSCTDEGPGPSAPDELNLIIQGRYYGHPNRNRGRSDERQCSYHPASDASGDTTPPLATLGYHTSANGMAEYGSDAFGGRLRGNLVYVEWATGGIWRVVLSGDGTGVASISQLVPDILERPLDVAVGPDGTVYVAEMGADRIIYFTPAN